MQTEYSKVSNLQRCEELMQINCLGETGASCHTYKGLSEKSNYTNVFVFSSSGY